MTRFDAINVMLVEDNIHDVNLIKEAFEEAKLIVDVQVFADGEKALDHIKHLENSKPKALPDLIILDINLPKINGISLLREIKENSVMKIIPVVIVTTSSADEDILTSYQLHANCYITKPVNFNEFVKVVKSIEDFWFTVVKLPKEAVDH